MTMFFAMLIKPFFATVVFGIAYVVAGWLLAFTRPGRIRRLLTRQIGVKPENPRRYDHW